METESGNGKRAVAVISPQDSVALLQTSESLFKSQIYPHIKSKEQAFAIIHYGHEIGVGPMIALQNINFIQGKPACSGQLMLARAMDRGVTVQVIREDDKGCTLLFKRPNYPPYEATFDENDARAAGLLGKSNWKAFPKDMYYWRAVAKGVRRIAPDAIMGAYTPEELTSGQVLDVQAEVVKSETTMTTGTVTSAQWDLIKTMRETREIPESLDAELTAWAAGENQTIAEASEFIEKLKACPKPFDREKVVKWVESHEKKVYPALAVTYARTKHLHVELLADATDDDLRAYTAHIKEKIDKQKEKAA